MLSIISSWHRKKFWRKVKRTKILKKSMGSEDTKEEINPLFLQIVLMFQTAAMQQMGKLINPLTQEVERNLEQAKFSIDILGLLEEKTKGNLTPLEEKLLKNALYELRMNYLDELKNEEKPPT